MYDVWAADGLIAASLLAHLDNAAVREQSSGRFSGRLQCKQQSPGRLAEPEDIDDWQQQTQWDYQSSHFTINHDAADIFGKLMLYTRMFFCIRACRWMGQSWSSPTCTAFLQEGNGFTGTIPPFAGAPSLVAFSASSNLLTGSLPSDWWLLHQLQIFSVAGNALTGSIPAAPYVSAAAAVATTFQSLDFSGNQLTGNIPLALISQPIRVRLPAFLALYSISWIFALSVLA